MSSDLATTLEQCLSQIESARARVQSCLVSYPALAEELEPLLRTAEVLRTGPKPELSSEAEARIATLVFGKANPAPRPERRLISRRRTLFNRSWAFAALGAVLIVALLGSTGLAYAATDALPGSALYPAKLGTEAAWLWIAPKREEPALHLRFAQRRLAETEALALEGVVEPQVLEMMAGHVESALGSAQGMPHERALPLLQALVELSSQEEQTLAGLMAQVPAWARDHLQQALQGCREQGRQARSAVNARQPQPPGEQGQVGPGQQNPPPGQEGTEPAQEALPEGQKTPPGQEKEPPGLQKPEGDTEVGPVKDDQEEKHADKEEKDKEAEEEEKEAAEEEEEEKEAAEEEDKEDEKEEKEDEKEEKEDEKEEEKEEEEEDKDKDKE